MKQRIMPQLFLHQNSFTFKASTPSVIKILFNKICIGTSETSLQCYINYYSLKDFKFISKISFPEFYINDINADEFDNKLLVCCNDNCYIINDESKIIEEKFSLSYPTRINKIFRNPGPTYCISSKIGLSFFTKCFSNSEPSKKNFEVWANFEEEQGVDFFIEILGLLISCSSKAKTIKFYEVSKKYCHKTFNEIDSIGSYHKEPLVKLDAQHFCVFRDNF